jgi:hypothetical protein
MESFLFFFLVMVSEALFFSQFSFVSSVVTSSSHT